MIGTDSSPVLFDFPKASSNVFIMMRFQETKLQHEILGAIKDVLKYYGLIGLRADDKNYSDSLWSNVKSYMDACCLGISVFEQIEEENFNPNVSLELGYMIAHKKPVLLLKEKHLKTLPSDVVGNLYRTFDAFDVSASIRISVLNWLKDVGIAKSAADRVVLFVSNGGTCRCAMAKVVLEQTLTGRRLPYRLRVVSVAHKFGGTEEASRGARRAVYDTYGVDFLECHHVTRQNPGLLADADLILTMEDQLRKGLPDEKTFNFNDFMGLRGDVPNPWPDDEDEATRIRYRECMQHLRSTLTVGVDKILNYLIEKVTPK